MLSQPLNLSELRAPPKSHEWRALDSCQDPLMRQEECTLPYYYSFSQVSILPCVVQCWRLTVFSIHPFFLSLFCQLVALPTLPYIISSGHVYPLVLSEGGYLLSLVLLGEVLEDHSWQWVVHVHDAQNEGTWFCWLPWHSPEFTVVYIGSSFHCFSVPLKTTLVPLYTHRPSARFFFSYFFHLIKTI